MTKEPLRPLSFDIETSGFTVDDVVTVAGLRFDAASWLCLNQGTHEADADRLQAGIGEETNRPVRVEVVDGELALLERLREIVVDKVLSKDYLLVAFNAEVWKGGFDLPFLRSACAKHDADWPLPDIPYADLMPIFHDRMNTQFDGDVDVGDLDGLHEHFFSEYANCDPFESSESAVSAWEDGEFVDLLLHNLSDIERTQDLARLAQRLVPASDFKMKNLGPPSEKRW